MEARHRLGVAAVVFVGSLLLSLALIFTLASGIANPFLGAFGVALLAAIWAHENTRAFACPHCHVQVGGLRTSHWGRVGTWLDELILQCSRCGNLVYANDRQPLTAWHDQMVRRDLGLDGSTAAPIAAHSTERDR